MIGYLLFRLLVECIKPVFYVYPGGLSGLQWLCVAGLTYYLRDIPRILRTLIGKGHDASWEPR
jgi:phosphatidylglycerol:prolipoprotein diacylglycerol transferase